MGVELPFAPVDELIRRNAGGLRVSSGATEALAGRIQEAGARRAVDPPPDADALALPVAPVDRIARLDIENRYRVSMDARLALASQLEAYADTAAAASNVLARHADRRTITEDDVRTYYELESHFE